MIDVIGTIKGIVWIASMFATHEFGHYWIAKKHNIYKVVGFFPGGVCVQMTNYLPNRWEYLYGILFSIASFPIYLLMLPDQKWYLFFPFAVAIGIIDILVCIFYTPIVRSVDKQRREKNVSIAKQ